MDFKGKWREDIRVDVTPLVDVVFNLLLFFMVTTTFVIAPAIKVTLPNSKAVDMKKSKKELRIVITKDRKIYYNQEQIDSFDELTERLRRVAEENAEATVIIQADTDVNHGTVVKVMDSAKSVGLSKLAIATEPEEK